MRYNLGDKVSTIPTRMGGLKKITAIIKMLWVSEADDTIKNDKDKNLQNIDLLYCDSLDCKRTFL